MEGLSKKERGFMAVDNRGVIAGGGGTRGLNVSENTQLKMFKGRGRRREDSGRHTKKAVMKEAESGAVLPNPGSPRTPEPPGR